MIKSKRRQSGFTLVEVLMGIMIFGILSTTIYGVFANAIRLNRQARDMEAFYRDARWVVDTLALDLENMVPYTGSRELLERREVVVNEATKKNVTVTQRNITGLTEEDVQTGSFIGQEQSLAMVIPTSDGLKEVVYYLESPKDNRIYQVLVNRSDFRSPGAVIQAEEKDQELMLLIREERPFPYWNIEDISSEVQKEVMGSHILPDSLHFSYAGPETANFQEGLEWESEWSSGEQPVALRFEITFVLPQDGRQLVIDKKIQLPALFKSEASGLGQFIVN